LLDHIDKITNTRKRCINYPQEERKVAQTSYDNQWNAYLRWKRALLQDCDVVI
jgi:hypothetical protein